MSKNKNPTEWDNGDTSKIRVIFLNCRSMLNKFENIKADRSLRQGDLIILSETWLGEDHNYECYILPDFKSNLNNGGRGKGIAAFYNEKFAHKTNIKMNGMSISILESEEIDVIGVYRSQEGDLEDLIKMLETLIGDTKTTIIGGDLNICILRAPNNIVTSTLQEKGFLQVVKNETHIDGGLLDHVYIGSNENRFAWEIEEYPNYYSDHDGICLILWRNDGDPN